MHLCLVSALSYSRMTQHELLVLPGHPRPWPTSFMDHPAVCWRIKMQIISPGFAYGTSPFPCLRTAQWLSFLLKRRPSISVGPRIPWWIWPTRLYFLSITNRIITSFQRPIFFLGLGLQLCYLKPMTVLVCPSIHLHLANSVHLGDLWSRVLYWRSTPQLTCPQCHIYSESASFLRPPKGQPSPGYPSSN